jgi:hypothetical protein
MMTPAVTEPEAHGFNALAKPGKRDVLLKLLKIPRPGFKGDTGAFGQRT